LFDSGARVSGTSLPAIIPAQSELALPGFSVGENAVPAERSLLQRRERMVNMDVVLILKSGFMGFALSLGVVMLVFYLAGIFMGISRKAFMRVFLLSALASFLAVDALLYYRIRVLHVSDGAFLLSGCIGGWLSGITFGVTRMKSYLVSLLK